MTNTEKQIIIATPKRLFDCWGIKAQKGMEEGDVVCVVTKSGKSWTAQIIEIMGDFAATMPYDMGVKCVWKSKTGSELTKIIPSGAFALAIAKHGSEVVVGYPITI